MRVILSSPLQKDFTVARNTQAPEGTSPGTELNQDNLAIGKGRPTPTRKQKEAARKRPLVSNDRAERRRQERAALAGQRERQRIGQANGEEKFLPIRDRGPQRRYIRDYVDARTGISELFFPLILIVLVATFFPQYPVIYYGANYAMYVFVLLVLIDVIILGFVVKRKLVEKFGSADKGLRLYTAMRAVYFRPMRLPKPQVKRGAFPA
jgi:hypothetical protein